MAGKLAGKVALITGAGSGIGRATALTFAREGAKVALFDVNAQGVEETAKRVKEGGGEAIAIKGDVSKSSDVSAMVAQTVAHFHRLDCAFNNAGVDGPGKRMPDTKQEDWDRVIAINLTGVWLCMKAELTQMLKQGGGTIVNTSSVAGVVGMTRGTAYVAAKHGVIGLTKPAALEYAKSNIRVNAVCPGVIHTAMVDKQLERNPAIGDAFIANTPVGRMGKPEDVAEAVLWLSSDASSFVTGTSLVIDGGFVVP
ncbi:MAG: SDR family oxidoreductase [Candidatus Binatia bacterium]